MLLWTGDLTNVSEGDSTTFERQLLAWRAVVKPLYDHGVTVLPVRGNHEVVWYDPKDSSRKPQDIPDAKATWDKVFAGKYALPPNGPDGEKNISFFNVLDSMLVVGVDHYTTRHSVNQTWLSRVLEQEKKPFIFVYGHEPAFAAGSHPDNETLATDSVKRNEFWESLIKAGARVYFCGHDHFYDHMSITRPGVESGPEMHQLTAGTAGAPFYEQGDYNSNSGWKLGVVHHAKTYGYIVAAIEGHRATITFKGRMAPGQYEMLDAFSYLASDP
jgi:Calcineurin-like phosphoesterase